MKEGRVYPSRRGPETAPSEADRVEMAEVRPRQRNNDDSKTLHSAWEALSRQANTLSKWKSYTARKRETPDYQDQKNNRSMGLKGLKSSKNLYHEKRSGSADTKGFLDSDCDEGSTADFLGRSSSVPEKTPQDTSTTLNQHGTASNRALLIYFAKLARADPQAATTVVDFDFVDSLLRSGADVNVCDRYGQTIFHEAARAWHSDVALFLLENGGDVNKPDKFGRTPLHVAAAVDYPEMITFLYEHGANVQARTFGEQQTPVHYAAKNDADSALKTLMKIGADVNCRDYKERTPLQVAAELDRSATAKLLVQYGVPCGVCDENGLSALALMVSKMPPVAKEALDQFHSQDRANRKQYYYLNFLVPKLPEQEDRGLIVPAKTPLEEAIRYKQMELVMHPVFQRLIQVKWENFGKSGSLVQVFVQLLYCLIWTTLGITLPRTTGSSYYDPPSKYWWRIVLESLAVSITALFIWQEIAEMRKSRRQHERWKKWRIGEITRDLKYCHPRWPEEGKYIKMEIESISSRGLSYFQSYWNYFDWVTYAAILAVIVTRIISVAIDNKTANRLHPRVMAITLIFIWFRLMKVFRVFRALGPFIVMIGHIIKDTLVFGFLYVEFFIPYVCAFWIIFGGEENAQKMKTAGQDSEGWRTFNNLMYSVWEITVVGNYSWESLLVVDRLMAQILCGTYLAVSSIICLNLFIALMSDTFQRVYDNANANAAMQKATIIQALETELSAKRKEQFVAYIHSYCAPEEMYYDDDSVGGESGELERLTHQINDKVNELEDMLKQSLQGRNEEVPVRNHINRLRENVLQVVERQNREMYAMRQDIQDIKQLLQHTLTHPSSLAPPPTLAAPPTHHSLPSLGPHPISPRHTSSLPKAGGSATKSRKHRQREDKSPPPPVEHIAQNDTGSPSMIGVDIRREPPPAVAYVAPSNQEADDANGSTC